MSKLTLTTEADRFVNITRPFAATPEQVYRAHTEPELIRQWMLGPEGWSMPVCDNDARPGGSFRYEWAHPEKPSFSITGEFISLEPFHRIVHVERMHLPDPTPDCHIETTFEPHGDGTLLRARMTLPDQAARDAMLFTGMEGGLEDSYARIDGLF